MAEEKQGFVGSAAAWVGRNIAGGIILAAGAAAAFAGHAAFKGKNVLDAAKMGAFAGAVGSLGFGDMAYGFVSGRYSAKSTATKTEALPQSAGEHVAAAEAPGQSKQWRDYVQERSQQTAGLNGRG